MKLLPVFILAGFLSGIAGQDKAPAQAQAEKLVVLSESGQYHRRVFLFTFINEQEDKRTQYLSVSIPEAFSIPLVKTGNFVVLNRASVQRYLEVVGIVITDLWKDENAVRFGKAVGADVVLVGRFVTQEKSVTVFVKAIDVQAGKISVEDSEIIATDTTMFNSIDALAKRMSAPMAEKMQPFKEPPPPAEIVLEKQIEEKKAAEEAKSSVSRYTADAATRHRLHAAPVFFLTQGKMAELLPTGFGLNAQYEQNLEGIFGTLARKIYFPALFAEAGFLILSKNGIRELAIPLDAGPIWNFTPFASHSHSFFVTPTVGAAYLSATSSTYSASGFSTALNFIGGYRYLWRQWSFSAALRYAYFFDGDNPYSLRGIGISLGVGYGF